MKFQLKVDDVPIKYLNYFCFKHGLGVNVDTMTMDLAEAPFKDYNHNLLGQNGGK